MRKIVQALDDDNDRISGYITDNLVYKDRLLSGIQVEALEKPADFVASWEKYIKDSVADLYGKKPDLAGAFAAYTNLMALPASEVNPLFAKFVEKFIEEFNKAVVEEDVVSIAMRKLEKKSS